MDRLANRIRGRNMVEGESVILAYGNYGGNVFRNGVRMKNHEDAITYRENEIWNFHKDLFHGVPGEKRVRLCGYKVYPKLFMDGKEVPMDISAMDGDVDEAKGSGELEGYRYAWHYDGEDNKLTLFLIEPDGTEWTGFSGYAMGAGWEDDEE